MSPTHLLLPGGCPKLASLLEMVALRQLALPEVAPHHRVAASCNYWKQRAGLRSIFRANTKNWLKPLAAKQRATASEAVGRWFESIRGRQLQQGVLAKAEPLASWLILSVAQTVAQTALSLGCFKSWIPQRLSLVDGPWQEPPQQNPPSESTNSRE